MKYCQQCGKEVSEAAQVCPQCGRPFMQRMPMQTPVMHLPTNRSTVKYILLSILTLGIYGIVEMTSISENVNVIASRRDGKKTMNYCLLFFVVSWLTLGIGYIVWYHRLSNRIGAELRQRQIPYSFGAGSFWGWNILGSLILIGPFVYLYRLMHAMNMLCENYNLNGQ